MTDSPLASSEWAALVAAMRFAPDDDDPRLIAADWLDDTRRPELEAWAEMVRVQVAAARDKRDHVFGDGCACEGCRAERRTTLLFDRWGLHWHSHQFGHCRGFITLTAGMYLRGFPGIPKLTLDHVRIANVPDEIADLFARSPLVGVHAGLFDGEVAARLSPLWWVDTLVTWHPPRANGGLTPWPARLVLSSGIGPGIFPRYATKLIDSHRTAWGWRCKLPGLIRATVRDVLKRRGDLISDRPRGGSPDRRHARGRP